MTGWAGRDVLRITDFSRWDLEGLFGLADELADGGLPRRDLAGRVVATAFFEPSTRTKLSFQAAAVRMGASVLDLPPPAASSQAKGETFADTVRMLDSYADVLVVRHRLEGAARFAAELAGSPVINGGDGSRDHPTQAMVDLYTVRRIFGGVDGLTYGVLGDLRYGRAARSFILGLTRYRPAALRLISPPSLRVRKDVRRELSAAGVDYSEVGDLSEVLPELDVLYVTRIQRERFPDPGEYERLRGSYRVGPDTLEGAKADLAVLHPLPRVGELDPALDRDPRARYFEQAANGVPVRAALLELVVGGRVGH